MKATAMKEMFTMFISFHYFIAVENEKCPYNIPG